MTIEKIITGQKPSLSFEVFPPKTEDKFESVSSAIEKIAGLKPSYMSVTYGAGGGTSKYTVKIASRIKESGVTPLAHLTCISSTKENVKAMLENFRSEGIDNILALRGDIPKEGLPEETEYRHASELMKEISAFGGFCMGGACYPETHPESKSSREDIDYLKLKMDCGCRFLTTQMFFDNDILYNFIFRAMKRGVDIPIVAGIMPVTSEKQVARIVSISGNSLPQSFLRIVDRYRDNPEAMKQAGILYATEQAVDLLANGINAVHIYTMNNFEVAKTIQDNLRPLIS